MRRRLILRDLWLECNLALFVDFLRELLNHFFLLKDCTVESIDMSLHRCLVDRVLALLVVSIDVSSWTL